MASMASTEKKGKDSSQMKNSNIEKISSIEIKIAGCSDDDNDDLTQQHNNNQADDDDDNNNNNNIDNVISNQNKSKEELLNENSITIHAYKKRFFILALFCAHSAINSFQWIQYSSITNVIADYYGASNLYVNLTSLVYMITYIPFIIHASLMLERVGLRKAVVLGTLGTALGSFIKWILGGEPGMVAFYWMMLGQTIVALSQLYIISIPPLLAAVWFPDHQVSTATGIGVFGNQFGIALGFIIPPMIITSDTTNFTNNNTEEKLKIYGSELNFLAKSVFWLSFLICIISILYFLDKPPKPPGSASFHAQQHQHQQQQQQHIKNEQNCTFNAQDAQQQPEAELELLAGEGTSSGGKNGTKKEVYKLEKQKVIVDECAKDDVVQNEEIDAFATIKELRKDKDFKYLVLSYGINVGCFYAISTVLNQMVSINWPDQVDLAGKMGLLIVVSGMAGSIICGQLLDRFHAYKLIIVLIYLFSLLSMLLFAIILKVLKTTTTWPLYLASIILGFFMTGYLPLGFEFAAEITYPHPANTPAGLLNLSAQVFGLMLTYISSVMVDELGSMWANSFLTICLVIGLILTLLMKADLKRQKAVAEEQMKV